MPKLTNIHYGFAADRRSAFIRVEAAHPLHKAQFLECFEVFCLAMREMFKEEVQEYEGAVKSGKIVPITSATRKKKN